MAESTLHQVHLFIQDENSFKLQFSFNETYGLLQFGKSEFELKIFKHDFLLALDGNILFEKLKSQKDVDDYLSTKKKFSKLIITVLRGSEIDSIERAKQIRKVRHKKSYVLKVLIFP